MKSPAVKPLVGPAQHARLGRAERLQPATAQVDVALAPRGNLRRLLDDRRLGGGPQAVGLEDRLVRMPDDLERREQLRDPAVQRALRVMLDERLHDADREPVLGAVEAERLLAAPLLLLPPPLEERLDRREAHDRDAL